VTSVLERSDLDLPLFRRGKVRDTYDLGPTLLMVATDRISAFDVVLPTPIPGKGVILTQLSRFWFEQTSGLVPNHVVTADFNDFPAEVRSSGGQLLGRAMIVQKAERIDVECVVRGYLAGSAWSEYRAAGTVAGETLPTGLRQGDRLPAPAFTPAAKSDDGHDVNLTRDDLEAIVGAPLARRLEEASRDLYGAASTLAEHRGIVLADTKFEFGFVDGELTLIDELLTPDSSRFWDATGYAPGQEQPSFDKQFVRDWLIATGWDKRPPAPELPPEVVAGTVARYEEAYARLTGRPLVPGAS
jgi:phosphoribosylaminoimidazole-succinocarboxamide synthase